jgi:hypothetical protein
MMVKKNQKDWDLQLPFAMTAYRSAVHSTTGETPYYMMFGREMTLPVDVLYGDPEQRESEVHEYTKKLKSRLEDAYQDARKQIESQHRTTFSIRRFRMDLQPQI